MYEDQDYHFQVLQQLRNHRNSSVHYDKESTDIETYLYRIKGYVESAIGFHVANKYNSDPFTKRRRSLIYPTMMRL